MQLNLHQPRHTSIPVSKKRNTSAHWINSSALSSCTFIISLSSRHGHSPTVNALLIYHCWPMEIAGSPSLFQHRLWRWSSFNGNLIQQRMQNGMILTRGSDCQPSGRRVGWAVWCKATRGWFRLESPDPEQETWPSTKSERKKPTQEKTNKQSIHSNPTVNQHHSQKIYRSANTCSHFQVDSHTHA